VALVGESVYGQ